MNEVNTMSEWQPIETAPRDGTSILVGANYERMGRQRVTLAWWADKYKPAYNGKWVESLWYDEPEGEWVPAYVDFKPTHWMPLPEPPNQEGSE